jgi:hypothetical protein
MSGIILSESNSIQVSHREVYYKLLLPEHHFKWNSRFTYLSNIPLEAIKNGSILYGTFKRTGKVIIYYEDIVSEKRFTFHYRYVFWNLLPLGEIKQSYKVDKIDGGCQLTQSIMFEPRGLGRLLQGIISDGLRKRLSESMVEFRNYVEGLR